MIVNLQFPNIIHFKIKSTVIDRARHASTKSTVIINKAGKDIWN